MCGNPGYPDARASPRKNVAQNDAFVSKLCRRPRRLAFQALRLFKVFVPNRTRETPQGYDSNPALQDLT